MKAKIKNYCLSVFNIFLCVVQRLHQWQVSQLGSLTITNKLLCGGRFCNTKGTRFAVSAYDNAEILTFRTANAE